MKRRRYEQAVADGDDAESSDEEAAEEEEEEQAADDLQHGAGQGGPQVGTKLHVPLNKGLVCHVSHGCLEIREFLVLELVKLDIVMLFLCVCCA